MLIKPIFIITIHRSGSTLLKNILNKNSIVAMATDEMHISVPFYTTFDNILKNYDLKKKEELIKFVDLIFLGKIKGSFWKDYSKLNINKHNIVEKIYASDKSLKSIISILLEEFRCIENKLRVGVKYPLHHSKTKMLIDWFPDAKIIFLTRDIRGVLASKLKDEATIRRKSKLGFLGFIIHYFTLCVFVFDFIWFSKIIEGYKGHKNCYNIKYEQIGEHTKTEITTLCSFLEIPFEENMLNADGKSSSHNGKIQYGFDLSRINKWENILNRFDKFLIKLFCYKSLKRVGY